MGAHLFARAGNASSRRCHTTARGLEQKGDNVAPDKQPDDDARLDEQTSFFSEMCCETRQDDVVVRDEGAWREEDKLRKRRSAKIRT